MEDNPDHLDLFNAHLEMTSFHNVSPDITDSLEEGVKLLNKKKYDLLFLDLTLIDSNIFNTLEKIKDLTEFCPVVVLTSLDDTKTILDIIQKGADDCFPKSDLSPGLLERSIQFNIDRRADKQKLMASEERLRALISNIPGVSYRCALDKDWTMEFISDAIYILSGYPSSDFINNKVRSYAGIIHPDDTEMVENTVLKAVNIKKPFEIQYRVIHLDGTIKWVYERGQAFFNKNGEVCCLDGVIVDDTVRKKMEDNLHELNRNLEKKVKEEIENRMQKEQLLIQQSKLAAMGDMIGAIAHQWRQPLNALGVMIQDIQDAYEFGELDKKYIDEMVKDSGDQIQFMSKTIDDFRNFYRASKDKETFSVIKAIKSVVSLQDAQLKHNRINVVIDSKSTGALTVTGHPNEFQQVVINIINNGRDAIIEAREERTLIEGESEISIDISLEEETITIITENKGKNIPAEIMNRIFEPYFTTKKLNEGTGIGLYMSKVIIENNMGGRLFATNVSDGVRFTIELPAS